MIEPVMIVYIIVVIFIALAFVVMLGKGDFLISAYNRASKEEKTRFNMPRLRLLTSALILIVSIALLLGEILQWSDTGKYIFVAVVILLSIIATILSNSWAKNK